MFLKALKISGFKSFADNSKIEFPSSLISIVGPNGCGKSNIIDAVRWVMGEGSAKQLRMPKNSYVIFNGSSSRNSIGMAKVELIFDNKHSKIGGEYANYSEISVVRKIHRDGLSQYYLNKTKCRRKDILDVFFGTGLGKGSNYAIIEQGMISELVESKPEEVRLMVEEAAGISKYKERKHETNIRIQHTKDNLLRLADIEEELKKQLRRLKKQAKTAKNYKNLRQNLSDVKAIILSLQYQDLKSNINYKSNAIRANQTQKLALETKQLKNNKKLEKIKINIDNINDNIRILEKKLYQKSGKTSQLEHEINHYKTQVKREKEQLITLDKTIINLKDNIYKDDKNLKDFNNKLELANSKLIKINKDIASISKEKLKIENRISQITNELSQKRELLQNINLEKNNINTSMTHHNEQIIYLSDKYKTFTTVSKIDENLKQKLNLKTKEINTLKTESNTITTTIEAKEKELKIIKNKIDECNLDINNLIMLKQELTGKLASLQLLKQKYQDKYQTKDELNLKRLNETIKVKKGYELALETVLDKWLFAYLVNDLNVDVDIKITNNKVKNLPNSNLTTKATNLLDVVECDYDLKALIGNIWLVDDINIAYEIQKDLEPYESLITKDGVFIGANWIFKNTNTDFNQGILAINKDIKVNDLKLVKLENKLSAKTRQLADLTEKYEKLNLLLKDLTNKNRQYFKQINDLDKITLNIQNDIDNQLKQFELHKQIKTEVLKELESQKQKLSEKQTLIIKVNKDFQISNQEVEKISFDLAKADEKLNLINKELMNKNNLSQEERLNVKEFDLNIQAITKRKSDNLKQIDLVKMQKERISQANVDFDVVKLEKEKQKNIKKQLKIDKDLNKEKQQLNLNQNKYYKTEHKLNEIIKNIKALSEKDIKDNLALKEVEVEKRQIELKINSKKINVNEILEDISSTDIATYQEKVVYLQQNIDKLGDVNLVALTEYGEQNKRAEFLKSQREDLEKSLATLEQAIIKIDKRSKKLFKKTYSVIDANFKDIFPKLFGGGKANLHLDGNDYLLGGITIFARPPGKKNSSLQMLSGGEKALTAIAFIFAIFQLNPPPFCLLDEVDAPLDDANVERFCALVKEMSQKVQFIIVTHNKITMEFTNQLIGITMHEPGVSRVVSVDIDEALKLSE